MFLITQLAEREPEVLKEVITVSEEADRTPGSTSALNAGEQVPVGELLYGLMLPSGNDAAVTLAEHFGKRFATVENGESTVTEADADPLQQFVDEMNRTASEIGMKATHFNNPHGLPSEGHQTSARDLARLAVEAFKLPLFRTIVATPQHGTTVDSISGYRRNVVWRNTNQLLRTELYDGIKTGTTGAAGNCLVSTGTRCHRRLIVVVLGAPSTESRYADTRNLYRWAWKDLLKLGTTGRKNVVEAAGN
jgi:D-alanyl-D-alanine carboxypeptidase (penicillin-binding protein 5/6)